MTYISYNDLQLHLLLKELLPKIANKQILREHKKMLHVYVFIITFST